MAVMGLVNGGRGRLARGGASNRERGFQQGFIPVKLFIPIKLRRLNDDALLGMHAFVCTAYRASRFQGWIS